ncbi:MAG: N-acetyltransferase [Gammaproteobacteria bacterium]|nr:MAG: N-acetyltransferase [Gammaproteobacteria bacterium]UTW41368.1 GNAT family N-acetyltransferase [bacterium SCSIO 12844]
MNEIVNEIVNMAYYQKQPFKLDKVVNNTQYLFKQICEQDLLQLALLHSKGFNVPFIFSIDEIEAILDSDDMINVYKFIDKKENIIGMLVCEIKNNICEITNFVIDKNYQCNGLGKLFMKKCLNTFFVKYSISNFVLSVVKSNRKAYHLYTSLGFNQKMK